MYDLTQNLFLHQVCVSACSVCVETAVEVELKDASFLIVSAFLPCSRYGLEIW